MIDDKYAWERKTLPSTRGYGPANVVWLKSPFWCLMCGAKDVWQPEDEGEDYYTDAQTTCHSCQHKQACMPHHRYWDAPRE